MCPTLEIFADIHKMQARIFDPGDQPTNQTVFFVIGNIYITKMTLKKLELEEFIANGVKKRRNILCDNQEMWWITPGALISVRTYLHPER